MIVRRLIALTSLLAAILAAWPALSAPNLAAPNLAAPNIMFVYVDDLGYGDLASYGHPVVKTPHLDRLADQGVRLTNYYAPSALCSPSRAAVLTGRHPYRTGIRSWIPADAGIYLHNAEITLAELLKGAGYNTALIGKWHLNSDLGSNREPQPTDQGFDYFYGHNAFQIPTNRNPTNLYRNTTRLPEQQGYTAQLYADEAIQWMQGQSTSSAPFFLFLSMAEPHTTIENPPEYNNLYNRYTNGSIVPIPSGLPTPPTNKLVPRGPGEYYANITYMDAQIGRVLTWLDTQGLAENTAVIFTSDNGPVTEAWLYWYEVNAHGSTGGLRGRKHQLYEGGIKVPAIVRIPQVTQPGSVSNALVTGTDWFSTLAALAGVDLPSDRTIDGLDVTSVLADAAAQLGEREILWALDSVLDIEFAYRRGHWKLLANRDLKPAALYNLQDDPLELFDQLSNKPQLVRTMLQRLQVMLQDIKQDPVSQ